MGEGATLDGRHHMITDKEEKLKKVELPKYEITSNEKD